MIYFIRHGETDYNKEIRMQGHTDIPLNKTGISQAELASEEIKNIKLNKIYSSPLSRAKLTAEIINKYHNIQIILDDRLKERFMGNLENKILKDIPQETLDHAFSHLENYGGESLDNFYGRVVSFFKEIENNEENILIVAHGGVYRCLYQYLNNVSEYSDIPKLPNATLVKIK